MKHSRNLSLSEFEQHRVTQNTFKRNKQYFDFKKVNSSEHLNQIKRREPNHDQISPKANKIDLRIGNSFSNSINRISHKVDQDMEKFKNRLSPKACDNSTTNQSPLCTARTSFYNPNKGKPVERKGTTSEDQLNPQITASGRTSQSFEQLSPLNSPSGELKALPSNNKIKGIPINRQITRGYLYKLNVEKKKVMDERLFNNFKINKNDLSKTQDFKKLTQRNIDFVDHSNNDLLYNTQQQYQKVYFSDCPMKTTFRYSIQNQNEPRKFFTPKRQENCPKTDLSTQKILKSFNGISNFKRNRIDNFYKMTDRTLPHQLDQRMLSPNKNFYKDQNGRLLKHKVDFIAQSMYDQQVSRHKQELFTKKNPEFTRDEICDERYFKEMIKREKRMADRKT